MGTQAHARISPARRCSPDAYHLIAGPYLDKRRGVASRPKWFLFRECFVRSRGFLQDRPNTCLLAPGQAASRECFSCATNAPFLAPVVSLKESLRQLFVDDNVVEIP